MNTSQPDQMGYTVSMIISCGQFSSERVCVTGKLEVGVMQWKSSTDEGSWSGSFQMLIFTHSLCIFYWKLCCAYRKLHSEKHFPHTHLGNVGNSFECD